MGVSIENSRFTWRADVLREIPAAVRFISAEPLLGSLYPSEDAWSPQSSSAAEHVEEFDSVAAARFLACSTPERSATTKVRSETETESSSGPSSTSSSWTRSSTSGRAPLDLTGIDWVIAGGESGSKARPSHPNWFRELRDACLSIPCGSDMCTGCDVDGKCFYGRPPGRPGFFFKQWGEWAPGADEYTRSGEWHSKPLQFVADCLCSEGTERMVRVGKSTNGRLLDGRLWDEFPACVKSDRFTQLDVKAAS
jgi:hypothetical protein